MKLKLMTSNIWGDYFGNPVDLREDGIFNVYNKYSPDFVGFQEVTRGWYAGKMFSEYLSQNFRFVGTELDGCENYVPFVFRKSAGLSYIAKGYELLSETPDLSKAITWAVFENKDKERFGFCNTHFWWKTGEEHDIIRKKNARQLSELMADIQKRYECPVFAMGDMNCDRYGGIFEVYKEYGITHLSDIAEKVIGKASCHGDPVKGDDGKYHGKKDVRPIENSIDHIIALGKVSVKEYLVNDDQDALDSTDHSPVMATVEF